MHCSDQSMRAISDILSPTGTKLLHLGLKNNLSHPESKLNVENLFQALTHNRYLTYLKISGNNLNDEDMARLSRILTTEESNIITSIRTLSVTDNLISDEGLLTLASRLSDTKSLKHLDVRRNPITDRSKKAMISALKNNVQIERLDLDGSWDTEKFWWLSLNRGGRRALQTTTENNTTVPSNLWP
ncbi:RNI-like protein, partial [Fragilariopsis cylindrus CCMP1102]